MRSERNSYAQRHLFNLISAPMVCTVCSFSHTTSTVHKNWLLQWPEGSSSMIIKYSNCCLCWLWLLEVQSVQHDGVPQDLIPTQGSLGKRDLIVFIPTPCYLFPFVDGEPQGWATCNKYLMLRKGVQLLWTILLLNK